MLNSGHDYVSETMRVVNVGAMPGSDAFLIITEKKSALIDSGFAFCADTMIENIERELNGRALDYILLTHSHYDHAAGSAACRAHFKGSKIAASEYAAKILAKPSALSVIREMDDSAAEYYGFEKGPDIFSELKVDIVLHEGDIIDLGGITLKVLDAPGHTKCSIAFYSPEEKTLISCETAGCCTESGFVCPCFLVGYAISIDFINRARAMDIEKILVPHFGVLKGVKCHEFLDSALSSAELLKDTVINDHKSGLSNEEITEHCKSIFYKEEIRRIQPEKAFYLNASYLIPSVIKEIMG
jgi:Zn-dependent hydrolases, including glyoxylases